MALNNDWEEIKQLITSKIVMEKSNELQELIDSYEAEWEKKFSHRVAPGRGTHVRNLNMFVPLKIYANTVFHTGSVEYKTR